MENDENYIKGNFWLAWILANSIGLGLGLSLGEIIGRLVIGSMGWRFGQLLGLLVCEGCIWSARGMVLSRFQMQKAFLVQFFRICGER